MKTKTTGFVIVLLIGVMCLGMFAYAQRGPAPAVPSGGAAVPKAAPPADEAIPVAVDDVGGEEIIRMDDKALAVTNTSGDKISITLTDVEMADVVLMFTKISGANIIATPSNLTGRVTVNLNDVEWKPALESILETHSLALLEKVPNSGVYTIVTKTPGAPEPMIVDTIFLKYASVASVKSVVAGMVAGGSVSSFPSRNALVIRTTSTGMNDIKNIIQLIDIIRQQVFIEAKFMELNDQAIKDLGINWQVLQGYNVSVGNLLWGYQEDRTWTETRNDTKRQWDNRTGIEGTAEAYDEFGNRYPHTALQAPANTDIPTVGGQTPPYGRSDYADRGTDIESTVAKDFTKTTTDLRSAVLGAADMNIVLSALKQMNGVSIVSNPKIVVANEEPAKIHIGQTERPFIATVTPATDNSAPFTTYNPGSPVEFGVKLTVTPTINTESNITVKIEPQLTRKVGDDIAPDGQRYPIVATKTISTVFCLENGKTVAIGGLTETEDRDAETKIPLLGDIPIIGKYFFSHSHKEKQQSETIIFVTVGLASPEAMQEDDGLPELTELTQREVLKSRMKKQKSNAELETLREAASAKSDTEARKIRRLLRRRK
ncbi:type II secretion system protein GspD [Verrucomicrobiota bacterium]